MGLTVHDRCVDVISIIFSGEAPDFSVFASAVRSLFISTVRVAVCANETEAVDVIVNGETEAVAVGFSAVSVVVFTLILQSKVQAILPQHFF